MRHHFVSSLLLLTAACTASTPTPAGVPPTSTGVSQPAPSPEIEYSNKIDNRASGIVKELGLIDGPKGGRVKQVLITQYRALRDWQEANEKTVKALKAASHDKDTATAEKAKAELQLVMDTRKTLRLSFLEALSKDLSQDQITKVKDLMTYNKVQVTYTVYCAQNPWFSETDKAKVKAWLLEAREEAIDGGSADEKSDIFNKFKGRINNYISKNKPAK